MPFDRFTKKQLVIESLYRLVAYIVLSLGVLLYYFSVPFQFEQAVIPILGIILFLISIKICHAVHHELSEYYARQAFFILDCVLVAAVISAIHFSIVFSALIIIVLWHIKNIAKIVFVTYSIALMLCIIVIYLNGLLFFGFENYFSITSNMLTIYGFICFGCFLVVLSYFNRKYIEHIENTRNYYQEQMNRYVQFSNQLSLYAPRQLWQSIMSGETQAKIEYKRKKMTVFFSDIQGFTELAEKLIPDDLAFVLNDYLSHMTEIAKKYEATLDKFIGDGILIFFGDPYSNGIEQDAKRCIEMAISMRQQMHLLRERWQKKGFPKLHIRMGISTGYCHVGNYGSAHRMSYTLIGHHVNLASRLQAAADIDDILIADSTYHLVKDEFVCIPKAKLGLKGMSEPINTWQVLEKYTGLASDIQQWFDYEYKGFHLLLNLEEVQHYEYEQLMHILEKMIHRLKLQNSMTNEKGIAKLGLEDEVIEIVKKPQ